MLDAYTRRARLAPALLASLPAVASLGAAALSPEDVVRVAGVFFSVVGLVACGLVRDRGRAIESELWRSWGGRPTVRRLQWRSTGDAQATRRLHERVASVLGERLPTAEEEAQDPGDADQRYEEAGAALRELTRDHDRFPLVFEENKEYGFRRNTLGLRPLGIVIAATFLAVSVALLFADGGSAASRIVRWGGSGTVSLVLLVFWWRVVSGEWVRRAAELYSARLFEAVITLQSG